MAQLENAFNAFKSSPTAENAWKLQQEMVAYAAAIPVASNKPVVKEARKPAQLKTKKGGKWDERLKGILQLFSAFGWEVVPYKSNRYAESWKVTDAELNQAILYLTTDGFSMGSKKPDEVLVGSFEGYEERDRFDEFLECNGIEIDD